MNFEIPKTSPDRSILAKFHAFELIVAFSNVEIYLNKLLDMQLNLNLEQKFLLNGMKLEYLWKSASKLKKKFNSDFEKEINKFFQSGYRPRVIRNFLAHSYVVFNYSGDVFDVFHSIRIKPDKEGLILEHREKIHISEVIDAKQILSNLSDLIQRELSAAGKSLNE